MSTRIRMKAKKWIRMAIFFFDQSERAKSDVHFLGLYQSALNNKCTIVEKTTHEDYPLPNTALKLLAQKVILKTRINYFYTN